MITTKQFSDGLGYRVRDYRTADIDVDDIDIDIRNVIDTYDDIAADNDADALLFALDIINAHYDM